MRILLPLLLFASPLLAQAPYLVRDINTTYALSTESSSPSEFAAWRNRTYFAAGTETAGMELWSTDGTSVGTALVADILPGIASSNPASPRVVNDVLLFTARSVNHGIELWTTDGTTAGTKLFLDLNPGPNSAQPTLGIPRGNRVLFSADDGVNGRELWSTDGTLAGTRLIKDLDAGPQSSSPRSFVSFGGSIYFLTGSGLWKTDGTDAGTVKIATAFARSLTVLGSRMLFQGFTNDAGWELWTSDGTEAGTRLLRDIRPGNQGGMNASTSFRTLGGRMIFTANDGVHGNELWISDGTADGTTLVRDLEPGATGTWDTRFPVFEIIGGRAYFTARDDEHGHELWSTNGTASGTALFFDAVPGPVSSYAAPLDVVGTTLIFTTEQNFLGSRRLWATNGTAAGTRVLAASDGTAVGLDYYGEGFHRVVGDKLYFQGRTALYGTEPWVTDGTNAGTRMIANIAIDRAPSSEPGLLTATDNLLFFYATDGTFSDTNNLLTSLWRSDGTAGGTFKLRNTSQYSSEITGIGPYVFFIDEEDRFTRMISDGTIEGTKPAAEFLSRIHSEEIHDLYPIGGSLYVAAGDSFDSTLWITTPAPNAPATRLGSNDPSDLIEVAGRVLFLAETPGRHYGRGLWTTDGTAAGTYALIPDLAGSGQDLSPLATAGGLLFFVQHKDDERAKLWKSDGTIDGTVVVKELPFTNIPVELVAAGSRIYFATHDALWTSDGTEAGTIELAKPEFLSLGEENLHPVGNRLVFTRYGLEANVHELWGSDGTVAGTKLLARVPYMRVSGIDGLGYFAGIDDAHGTEPWVTDGTTEGTRLLYDLNPGPRSSDPSEFTKVAHTLYFSAYTDTVGQELWALALTEPLVSIKDARARESASVVRFTVSLASALEESVTLDYATSDRTARAGHDYEAASGSLTFAPGETTKNIDVRILGDITAENNETFVLSLRNVRGARVLNADAAGVVDDDDEAADLAVTPELSGGTLDLNESVIISNQGPRAATEVEVRFTSVPGDDSTCFFCAFPQIPVGTTITAGPSTSWSTTSQIYRSAIVTARQHDPDPSNNATSWTTNQYGDVAMDIAYLTPGATATISVHTDSTLQTLTPISSDPTVVSISSGVTKHNDSLSTFKVTAHKVGASTITVGAGRAPLVATVVAPGTTPRWADAFKLETDLTATRVDQPVTLTITPSAAAPLTGATATGEVTVTAAGLVIARHIVTGSAPVKLPLYFRTLGQVPYQIAYNGDANFLPQTRNGSVFVRMGRVSIIGRLERVPDTDGTFALQVRVEGAPGLAPTGEVSVFHNGRHKATTTLAPQANGWSTASVTLTGLPESPSLTVTYYSDGLFDTATQTIRLPETRRRNVRH